MITYTLPKANKKSKGKVNITRGRILRHLANLSTPIQGVNCTSCRDFMGVIAHLVIHLLSFYTTHGKHTLTNLIFSSAALDNYRSGKPRFLRVWVYK